MKYNKVIIPSIVAIVAISMWAMIPVSSEHINGIVTDVSVTELIDESELVIIGTYISQRTEDTGSDLIPLRSITNIKVNEVLKGTYNESTIQIVEWSSGTTFQNGYREEITVEMQLAEYVTDEQMIMFLYYDDQNTAGAGYYMDGSALGKFTIDGQKAIHIIEDRSTTIEDIKQRLQTALI